jgi:type II secretory pathway pseudopilin PulG
MRLLFSQRRRAASEVGVKGFTLAEVVVSIGIAAFTIGGVIACYLLAAARGEWSSASAAAHRLAMQKMEQWRGARWDLTVTNELLTNAVGELVIEEAAVLDTPQTGTNVLPAIARTTISPLAGDRPCVMVRVDCVWSLPTRGPFTNTLITYRAPDQ